MVKRIAILTISLISVLIILSEKMSWDTYHQVLRDSLEKRVATVADISATLATEAISLNFFSFVEEVVHHIKKTNPDVLYSYILNSDLEIMAHTDKTKIGQTGSDTLVKSYQRIWHDRYIECKIPIFSGERVESNLVFALGTSSLNQAKQRAIQYSVMKVLGVIVVGILLSYLLGIWISKPVKILSSEAQTLAAGNLDREIQTSYQAEIANLAQSFEIMRVSLKKRYDEIMNLNVTLDEKVKLRTAEVMEQKDIIQRKNQHITSSIQYAQKIQQAILPPTEMMRSIMKDSFVLYLPKDIVSGDFFWLRDQSNQLFLAAVDCTGHGVPGALMSMIGNTLLNQIINEKKITNPAKILEALHLGVQEALKQTDQSGKNREGMDMALIKIDKKSYKLTFSGARRPLYLVKDNQLTEIKGDKKSIGGFQKEEKRTFSNQTQTLQKGVMIYLTSDGFTDQLNPDSKKFGSKRLKASLEELGRLGCQDQKEKLQEILKNHQKTEEQQDDITIIGIRT